MPVGPTPVAYTRAAAAAATNLPGATLDLAIKTGELPAVRSGRRLIILQEDLIAWLRRCRARGAVPTPAPSQTDRERLAGLNRARKQASA